MIDVEKCADCSKDFESAESLDQHRQAKHVQHPIEEKKKGRFPIKLVAIAAIILLVGFAYFQFKGGRAQYLVSTPDENNVLGSANATVTIIEYSDFQCPFCGRFFEDTEPLIISQYVDSGKVKFVYRHYPLPNHQYAQKAAEASECASDQGKFWEYHNLIFKNQNSLNKGALKQHASSIGLDREKFDSCLASGVMASRVRNDLDAGNAAGVSSTPSFFINGKQLVGAQPFSAFANAIEQNLR